MGGELSAIVERFMDLRVLVVGEAMLDIYLEGISTRLCPEAPVPVIAVTGKKYAPGGAANAAVNIASLGGKASFISVVGNDTEGMLLKQALEERGVSADYVVKDPVRGTLTKTRIVAAARLLLRFDQGSADGIDAGMETMLLQSLSYFFPECDALLISDYGYGIMTPRIIGAIGDLQAESPRIVTVNAKNPERYRAAGVTAVKSGYEEALRLLKLQNRKGPGGRAGHILPRGRELLDTAGARIAAVTLGEDGAVLFERNAPPYRTRARKAPAFRTAGISDTFISVLTLALASGAKGTAAAELAATAAAIVAAKEGTASCRKDELSAALASGSVPLPRAEALSGLT